MRFKQVGNKRDVIFMTIHNADTVQIAVGTPVVFVMNGTNDGLDVVLPTSAGTYSAEFVAGVADRTMNVGDYAEACVFGIFNNVALVVNSRANSSASWSTQASIAQGVAISLNSAANAFSTVASTIAYVTASTAAAAGTLTLGFPDIMGVLATSVGTIAGSASSTANTAIYSIMNVEGFIRIM
jgi:hypothetical protein